MMKKSKLSRNHKLLILGLVLVIPVGLGLLLAGLNLVSKDVQKTVYSKQVQGIEVQVVATVTFDNYCKVDKLVFKHPGQRDVTEIPKSRYNSHCLNGTGPTGSDWLKVGDYNGDSKQDFKLVTGDDLNGNPTYVTYTYSADTGSFTASN